MRGKDEEATLKTRRNALEQKRDILHRKISHFRKDMDDWVKSMEEQVGLPQLASAIGSEIKLILDAAQSQASAYAENTTFTQLLRILECLNSYLEEHGKQPLFLNERDFWEYLEKKIAIPPSGDDTIQQLYESFSDVESHQRSNRTRNWRTARSAAPIG
jgi:hypothetical protein